MLMLTSNEHEAMIMFDRLLMAARENETISDLLDQTLNVARMIDPKHNEKITYGPLQRMHFEWQQMKYRMDSLEKKMDNYINQQNRYPGTWPSNPGGYALGTGTATDSIQTSGTGGYYPGYGSTTAIGASGSLGMTAVDVQELMKNVKTYNYPSNIKDNQAEIDEEQQKTNFMTEQLKVQLRNIEKLTKDMDDNPPEAK